MRLVGHSVATATEPSRAVSRADISRFGQLVSQAEPVVPTFLVEPSQAIKLAGLGQFPAFGLSAFALRTVCRIYQLQAYNKTSIMFDTSLPSSYMRLKPDVSSYRNDKRGYFLRLSRFARAGV